MEIELRNCNNIDNGKISIAENCLNIKYAINGTGKTTISKAIDLFVRNKEDHSQLLELKPFKFRNNPNENNPEIIGIESFNQIAIFNESYLEKYVFLPDELLKDSFEILVRDEKYEQGMNQINNLIKVIGETFKENEEIEVLLNDLRNLSDCFGKSKGLSKSSSFYKGLGSGNKVENIPHELEPFKDFIRHAENVKWLKWQMSGSDYLDISNICPYCTSEVEGKKETILAVKKEYDSKLVEHLNKVIDVVQRLSSYFTDESFEKIMKIAQSVDGIKDEHVKYLLEVREQINVLYEKISRVKTLSFQTLKDFSMVKDVIESFKIDLEFLGHLNSTTTAEKISAINNSLDDIITKAGFLQGEVNKQKKHIEKTIQQNNQEINSFLKNAGYNYQVNIEEDGNQTYRLILKHNDFIEGSVENARHHLSYGERNAFALVLFMFEAIKNEPDLIILDDPISSFDKNKKYAIIEMLFRGERSLRQKTVLMLTHDFDPIVDMIYHFSMRFGQVTKACFLENLHGVLSEKIIDKTDIKTFLEITLENIDILDENINKLIYLRRYLEINDDKSEAYQLLSNIFKKRTEPIYIKHGEEDRLMTDEEISIGEEDIKKYISNFDYLACIGEVTDTEHLIKLYDKASNNYEKLQLYRVINTENSGNDIIKKFVNETFHLENDYLYQLNPCKYQVVPQYIIDECSKDIEVLRETLQLV